MQVQDPNENGIRFLKCEHCGEIGALLSKPVPAVILPTLVCNECRKDASGMVIPPTPIYDIFKPVE